MLPVIAEGVAALPEGAPLVWLLWMDPEVVTQAAVRHVQGAVVSSFVKDSLLPDHG